MKVLASNNTMTYLKPAKRWMNLLKPFYRHQNRNLIEQLDAGVNFIYLKVWFNDFGMPVFKNGLYKSRELIGVHTIYKFVNSLLTTIKAHKKTEKFFIHLDLDSSDYVDKYQETMMEELCTEFSIQLKEMNEEENIAIWSPYLMNDSWWKFDLHEPAFIESAWYERLWPNLLSGKTRKKLAKLMDGVKDEEHWRFISDFI